MWLNKLSNDFFLTNDIICTKGEGVGLASQWANNNVIQSIIY